MDIRVWMSTLLFLAASLMLLIAFLSYQKRHLAVARTMILIMLSATLYTVGYACEILSRDLNGMLASLRIEYLGIPFIATLWLWLVIQFTGVAAGYRKRLAAALFVVPVIILLLFFTNDCHHFIYESFTPNASSVIPLYTTTKGPGYLVHTFYSYFMALFGIFLFIPMYWQSLPIVRKQIVVLIMGVVGPLLLNTFFWFGWRIDLTPFGFALSGVVYVWGIFRFNLLRLTPLALAKVFDTIGEGVVLLDHEDQIISYSRSAEEVLPELGGIKRWPAPIRDVLGAYPQLLARVGTSDVREQRFSFQRSDTNRIRHFACSLTGIFDADANPIGKLLTFNDITELKENEDRLRENARQLSELNAFKDKLFTVVAHDIRDPIALMVNLTELLEEDLTSVDAEQAIILREIQAQARSTFHLVDNLLDWYRSQRGHVVFRPLAWNLRQVVRQAMALAGARACMKQIRVTERIDGALTVSADKEMLDLILRNLLSNAIKFTGIGGTIEISAVLKGESIVVNVRDNGTGIDDETSELLRQEEPFLKLPGIGDEAGKTRFGLVLTREFLRINGGKLWFDSESGIGTTFSFSLPGSYGGRNIDETIEEEAVKDESDSGG